MSATRNTWAKHFQSVWAERAVNPVFPLWCRVAWVAYAQHKTNGHANFQRGQLSRMLGASGMDGFKALDTNNLQRAIRQAKKAGLLDASSCAECLVVPAHAIEGGWGGSPHSPCPVHRRKLEQRRQRAANMGR